MGSAVKSVTKVLQKATPAGFLGVYGNTPGGPGPTLNKSPFDIAKEAKKYEELYGQQRQQAEARQSAANAPAVIAQLSQQALGQGPSLAEAQLKSATNRNLAQQLAAASAMRGRSPAATQRQVLQQQGEAGRQLAEQSAVARLQEQQQAMQQLTAQQSLADALAGQSTQGGFQAAVAPKQNMQQYEQQRFNADVAKQQMIKQQQTAILGALIGAGGQAGAAAMGKPPGMSSGGFPSPGATNSGYGSADGGYQNFQYVANEGGVVPGHANKAGDHPANDTVHVRLSPDEIVIPRSAAKNAKKAHAFVDALFAKSASKSAPKSKLGEQLAKKKA